MALLKRIINKDLFSKIDDDSQEIHPLALDCWWGVGGDLHGQEDLSSGNTSSTVSILMECIACLVGLKV